MTEAEKILERLGYDSEGNKIKDEIFNKKFAIAPKLDARSTEGILDKLGFDGKLSNDPRDMYRNGAVLQMEGYADITELSEDAQYNMRERLNSNKVKYHIEYTDNRKIMILD